MTETHEEQDAITGPVRLPSTAASFHIHALAAVSAALLLAFVAPPTLVPFAQALAVATGVYAIAAIARRGARTIEQILAVVALVAAIVAFAQAGIVTDAANLWQVFRP